MLVMDEKTPTIYSDPDLLKQAEDLYFALSQNITIAGKNTIFHCIDDAKQYYHTSNLKQEWEWLLKDLGQVINDFENNLPSEGELKLTALEKNLEELKNKERLSRESKAQK